MSIGKIRLLKCLKNLDLIAHGQQLKTAICSCLAEIYSRIKSTELSISSTLILMKSSPDGRVSLLDVMVLTKP
jgi:hypothetical protein